MKKTLIIKIIKLVFLMVIVRIAIILSLNVINTQNSHYLEAQDSTVLLTEHPTSHLFYVTKISEAKKDEKILYIQSEELLEYSILIDNLTFMHHIYINDKLVSQNINQNEENYNHDYAYKIFQIKSSDYINKTIKIAVKGTFADWTEFVLSENEVLQRSGEFRLIFYVTILVLLIISTLISILLFYYNKREYHYLIFVLIGLCSITKSIVSGELFVISDLLNTTAGLYIYADRVTNVINVILPLITIRYLFDFRIKRHNIIIVMAILILLGLKTIVDGGNFLLFSIMFFLTFAIGNVIMAIGYIKEKPYSLVIMINAIIYSSGVIYYMQVLHGNVNAGNILFFIHPVYLGSVIYMSGFLAAIYLKHLDKMRSYEQERKEYERILLLRGIGHDLKLPLSVIKLNSQMLEKYELSEEEVKEYAKASLEAASELERMTENINSYLSINQILEPKEITSVKECFQKLKSYYELYNHFGEYYGFQVVCDEKDCYLNISPLHFSRMLGNLVDNAFKYNQSGVQVMVSYKIEKRLCIIVEDNGMGMEKTEIEKVFEPFYRVDQSRTTEGMGLGLTVVKGMIDRIGGTIEVNSEKGRGTQIRIIMPYLL